MKKLLTALTLFIVTSSYAQDSVRVSVAVQARDLEYLGASIYNDYSVEDLYDSIKSKFRVQNPPTGTTTVTINAYTMDWLDVLKRLRNDPLALKLNHAQRVDALLRAAGNTYLANAIDAMDQVDINFDSAVKAIGRKKLTRL